MKKIVTNFRKTLVALVAIAVMLVLAACGRQKNKSASPSPKAITLQLVPSQTATKLQVHTKPLAKMLSKRLGIPVHVGMATDYNMVIAAMKTKKVDVGFLPPNGYVLAHDEGAANLLLQAERYGVKQPTGQITKKLVRTYRGEILVKQNSKIKNWHQLKGKSISVQNPTSSAGYVFPVAELKQKGLNVTKDCKLVTVTGHDQAILNVLNGNTQAAFVYEDARNSLLKTNPKIKQEVVPIYFTRPIPNDTIAVIPSVPPSFRRKLAHAFIAISKSSAGKKVLQSIYGHVGYTYAKDSDYNIVRRYDRLLNLPKK